MEGPCAAVKELSRHTEPCSKQGQPIPVWLSPIHGPMQALGSWQCFLPSVSLNLVSLLCVCCA